MKILTPIAFATALLAGSTAAQEAPPAAQTQSIVQAPAGPGLPTVMVPPLTTPKVADTSAGQTHALGLQVAQIIAARRSIGDQIA